MKKILLLSLLSVLFVRSYAQQITFTPQWMPQSQFAGYYAALENGYNEQVLFSMAGITPESVLRFADMGYDFPEDGLYVLSKSQ